MLFKKPTKPALELVSSVFDPLATELEDAIVVADLLMYQEKSMADLASKDPLFAADVAIHRGRALALERLLNLARGVVALTKMVEK